MFSAQLSDAAVKLRTLFCKREIVRIERKISSWMSCSSVKAYSMLPVNADKDSRKSRLIVFGAKRVKIASGANGIKQIAGVSQEEKIRFFRAA